MRWRTTPKLRELGLIDIKPCEFVQEIRDKKKEAILKLYKKKSKEENRAWWHFPSFAIWEYGVHKKCSLCDKQWHPRRKRGSLNTYESKSNDKFEKIKHPSLNQTKDFHIAQVIDNVVPDAFYAIMSDADWTTKAFKNFYYFKTNTPNKNLIRNVILFDYLLDNYIHSQCIESSVSFVWFPTAEKGKTILSNMFNASIQRYPCKTIYTKLYIMRLANEKSPHSALWPFIPIPPQSKSNNSWFKPKHMLYYWRKQFCITCSYLNETSELHNKNIGVWCFACAALICLCCLIDFESERIKNKNDLLALSRQQQLGTFLCLRCKCCKEQIKKSLEWNPNTGQKILNLDLKDLSKTTWSKDTIFDELRYKQRAELAKNACNSGVDKYKYLRMHQQNYEWTKFAKKNDIEHIYLNSNNNNINMNNMTINNSRNNNNNINMNIKNRNNMNTNNVSMIKGNNFNKNDNFNNNNIKNRNNMNVNNISMSKSNNFNNNKMNNSISFSKINVMQHGNCNPNFDLNNFNMNMNDNSGIEPIISTPQKEPKGSGNTPNLNQDGYKNKKVYEQTNELSYGCYGPHLRGNNRSNRTRIYNNNNNNNNHNNKQSSPKIKRRFQAQIQKKHNSKNIAIKTNNNQFASIPCMNQFTRNNINNNNNSNNEFGSSMNMNTTNNQFGQNMNMNSNNNNSNQFGRNMNMNSTHNNNQFGRNMNMNMNMNNNNNQFRRNMNMNMNMNNNNNNNQFRTNMNMNRNNSNKYRQRNKESRF